MRSYFIDDYIRRNDNWNLIHDDWHLEDCKRIL